MAHSDEVLLADAFVSHLSGKLRLLGFTVRLVVYAAVGFVFARALDPRFGWKFWLILLTTVGLFVTVMRILQSLGVGQVHNTDCVGALARDLRSTEGKTRRRAVRVLASDESIRNVVLMARALVEAMNAIQQRGESAGSDENVAVVRETADILKYLQGMREDADEKVARLATKAIKKLKTSASQYESIRFEELEG